MGLLTALSGAGAVPGGDLGLLVSFGLLGASLLDRFRAGDETVGDDEGDPLLDDDGAFGDGDGGGGGDDLDGFGDMDDWDGDDPFGGEEEGDDTAELENRLEDLENEVASLSSTVSTVRSENEEISDEVEEMGEDVRSLLDIYEMVTRGINPFVDDAQGGGMGGDLGGDGSFGLFDTDETDEEEAEDLDDDVAGADAESFFDEDLIDENENEDEEGGDFDDLDDEFGAFDDTDDDTTDTETMATENGDGKSFNELKDEYESGTADWAEEGDDADPFDGDGSAGAGGSLSEADESAAPPADAGETDDGGFEFVEEDDLSSPRKPYLTALPGDYVGDLMVMEWLEYLVEESDATDAVRAVNYYERIEWIDEDVATRLKDFLSGFGDIDRNLVDEPGTARLTLDHHTQSLKYVMQLTDATAESVVIDRWPQLSGGMHGAER